MSINQRVDFFVRFINEKHNALLNISNQMIAIFASEDALAKKTTAERMLDIAKDLSAMMAEADIPPWLKELTHVLNLYAQGLDSSSFFIKFFTLKQQLDQHVWSFNESDVENDAFDFDSLFERYRSESRLPELFNEIIRILEEIHVSGQLDSVTLLTSLGKVIATVKKSKSGSYFSVNSAWEFLQSFLTNYLWGELEKLPVLGGAFAALKKTIDETSEEMFLVHSSVITEMNRVVQEEIKPLQGKQTFQTLSYEKNGSVKNLNETRLLPNTKA